MKTISHNKKIKLTTLALAMSSALVSFTSHAIPTNIISAGNQQDIALSTAEHYHSGLLYGSASAITASGTGKITGNLNNDDENDRLTISAESRGNSYDDLKHLATAWNGGQITIKNADFTYVNSSGINYRSDNFNNAALQAIGPNSLLDISHSTITSDDKVATIYNGATGRFDHVDVSTSRAGMQVEGEDSQLFITNSTIRGTQCHNAAGYVAASNGSFLHVSNSNIHIIDSMGLSVSSQNNVLTTAELKNVSINANSSNPNSTATGISYSGNAWANAENVKIEIEGNIINPGYANGNPPNVSWGHNSGYLYGISANYSQNESIFTGVGNSPYLDSYIKMLSKHSKAVFMYRNSQIKINNSAIITEGDHSFGLHAWHNGNSFLVGSATQTKITTINSIIDILGHNSYGAIAEDANTVIQLDSSQLTISGDNSTALYAKTEGAVINTDNGTRINVTGSHSTGVLVENGATVNLNNTILNVTGNNTSGGVVLTRNDATATNAMTISNSLIETQDGNAIHNKKGQLDLTLEGSTVIGRTNGEIDTAINVTNISNQSSHAKIEANNGSAIFGDIKYDVKSSSNQSSSLDAIFNNSSLRNGNIEFNLQAGNLVPTAALSVELNNGSIVEGNIILNNANTTSSSANATLDVTLNNSHFIGDILLNSTNINSTLNVELANNSSATTAFSRIHNLSIDESSTWNMTDDSTISSFTNFIHNGNINFIEPTTSNALTTPQFKTLTINQDYHGTGGTFTINTELNGDDSLTDNVVINGNTSGYATLAVRNYFGGGALTTEGIEVVNINAQSFNDITFTLDGERVTAGVYEYLLNKNTQNGNWYLQSQLAPIPPTPDPDPIPVPPVTPDPEPNPTPVYRPEAGGYLANLAAANKLFNLRLEDREGRAENSSLWLRQVASRNQSRDGSDQLRIATNSFVTQLGGEVWQITFNNEDRLGLGIMAAYGKANSESRSKLTHYHTKSQVDGYSLGLYSTWYQNAQTLEGAYVDSWLQYSWFDAEINGEKLASEKYDMDGMSASIEGGYRVALTETSEGQAFITPQAQMIWNGIKADNHREINGTFVKGSGHNTIQTRLGVTFSFDGVSSEDKGKDKLFTLYAEANWLYHSKKAGVIMDNVKLEQTGSRNVGEVKLGFEGQLNKHVHVWTNVAQQLGTKGYKDTAATVGVKYRF